MDLTVDHIRPLRHGTQIQRGLGVATVLADMDFETYSEAGYVWMPGGGAHELGKWTSPLGGSATNRGLGLVGAKVYTEHPSFEVLSLKYDLKDGRGVRSWRPGESLPLDIFAHMDAGQLIEAHNAGFEMYVWEACTRLYGWPEVKPDQFRCSMAKARAYALPGALGKLAPVLGTTEKDKAGDSLLRLFSVPQNPTKSKPDKRRVRPEDEPAKFAQLVAYNETDIVAEAHASIHVPDLSPPELEHWIYDQRINRRGVRVDEGALRAGVSIIQQAHARYGDEMRALTGGISPSEVQRIIGWCAALGVRLETLDDESLTVALARDDLPASVRRVLELRSLVASASVKKYFSMLNRMDSRKRLTDLFVFHGARTGRPTGEGPQPTNLPRSGPDVWRCTCGHWYGATRQRCPWCARGPESRVTADGEVLPLGSKPGEWNVDAMKDAIAIMSYGSLTLVEHFFGDAMHTLAGCLRGMFTATPGHRLMCADWTAIENVVLACMAGEQWRIDVLRKGGSLYEPSAEMITGVTVAEQKQYAKANGGQKHPARQIGKVAELALGYRGWIAAWLAMEKGATRSEEEIKGHIMAWRNASPMIVEFWGGQSRRVGYQQYRRDYYGVEGTFLRATLSPGQWFPFRDLWFYSPPGSDATHIRLPSGRLLTYHNVTLRQSERQGNDYDISYWGWNTNPINGPRGWIEIRTHGGKLTENIIQAVSNDILRLAIAKLEPLGYPVVLHVYDEIVCDVPNHHGTIEEMIGVMRTPPEWAKTPDGQYWPIMTDDGFIDDRYHK